MPKGGGDGLTSRQRAFVHAYATNGQNGTAAAKAAGYAGDENALAAAASRLLRVPKVRKALDRLVGRAIERAERRTIADLRECLEFTTTVMRTKLSDFIGDDGELSVEKIRAAPAGVIKRLQISSTTDEEGQVFARHTVEVESGLSAAQTLIKHYQDGKDGAQRERALTDALAALPVAVQVQLARAMLAGPKPIDVQARVLNP